MFPTDLYKTNFWYRVSVPNCMNPLCIWSQGWLREIYMYKFNGFVLFLTYTRRKESQFCLSSLAVKRDNFVFANDLPLCLMDTESLVWKIWRVDSWRLKTQRRERLQAGKELGIPLPLTGNQPSGQIMSWFTQKVKTYVLRLLSLAKTFLQLKTAEAGSSLLLRNNCLFSHWESHSYYDGLKIRVPSKYHKAFWLKSRCLKEEESEGERRERHKDCRG